MRALVITGTPATGKSTLAKLLEKRLRGAMVIDVNKFAIEHRLIIGKDKFGSKIIDTRKLARLLNKIVEESNSLLILEGHLLCDMRVKEAKAVVLREHLKTLKKRMEKRGYDKRKIYDNLVAEATDYCGIEASKRYKQVGEFLSSDPQLVKKVIKFVEEGTKGENIDLLNELLEFMKSEKNFSL